MSSASDHRDTYRVSWRPTGQPHELGSAIAWLERGGTACGVAKIAALWPERGPKNGKIRELDLGYVDRANHTRCELLVIDGNDSWGEVLSDWCGWQSQIYQG